MPLSEEQLKQETENIGIVFDKLGFPPIAGRIMAFLMLSEPPHKSFDEIVAQVQASKSSVSTTLKFLDQQGMIDYKTYPGDRRRYFRVAPEKWYNLVNVTDKIRGLIEMFNHVLELRGKDEEMTDSLKEVRDMYLYFEVEIPKIIQKWHDERSNES
jgi:DNA-binding transcriptional regulator GbsR (MarR family)